MILDQPNEGREAACKFQLTVANFLKTLCMFALLLSVDAKYTSFNYLCWGTGNHTLKDLPCKLKGHPKFLLNS